MRDAYDLVVIGGGPAGQGAAELAAFYGRSVLLVQDGPPGGAVTTTGGVPTKTLREVARHVRDLGSGAVPPEQVLLAMGARASAVCATVQRTTACEIAAAGVTSVRGRARLVDDRTVRVGDRPVRASAVVIATGSRPRRLPFDDPDVYDSDGIFGMRKVPRDVVVVGAGAVGIEYATVFAALGVAVTVVDRADRPLPGMDEELVDLLVDECRGLGIRFVHEATVADVTRTGGRLAVTLSSGARLSADAVLLAAGRAPVTDDLGLDEVGVRLGERGGIVVDAFFRTSVGGIYAVGDVVASTLASTAAQQGRAAACHALGLVFGVAVDRAACTAVYGLPEIAGVGATEQELAAVPHLVGRCDLAATPRGAIAGKGGLLKVIFRPDDRKLLGVHCVGEAAAEVVGLGQLALQLDAALDVFLSTALATPTYSAAYHTAAVDGIARLAQLQAPRTEFDHEPHR